MFTDTFTAAVCYVLGTHDMLLDNQSTISRFYERALVSDIQDHEEQISIDDVDREHI